MMKMVGVLAIAACVTIGAGGLGDAAVAMSAKDFRKTANDICRQGRMLREEIAQDHFGDLPDGQQPTADQLRNFVEEYRSAVQQQIDSLRALRAPASMKANVKRMLVAAKTALARVVADPTILTGTTDPFAVVTARATALGLAQCAA